MDDYTNYQYDVDKAQKYAHYYQGDNAYYNQTTSNKSSSPAGGGGLIAIPFVIALFTFLKYMLTILLVPAIPAMFAGYKISLMLPDPNTPTKLIFIFFFGFLGFVLQLALVRVLIDFVFKREFVKWVLYAALYTANLYLIFWLADHYPVKDLVHTKQALLDVYRWVIHLF